MDGSIIGAVLALLKKKGMDLTGAVKSANEAASAANAAASKANAAAGAILPTAEEAQHTLIALNFAYTTLQAQLRADGKNIETLQKQVKNITG